jgi:hypothetical protein
MKQSKAQDCTFQVPPGVLTILPGQGNQTGKWIVQNPLVRKIDITVSSVGGDGANIELQCLVFVLEGWYTNRTGYRQHRRSQSRILHS